jgi:4'-phosphopantetheinyl transferase
LLAKPQKLFHSPGCIPCWRNLEIAFSVHASPRLWSAKDFMITHKNSDESAALGGTALQLWCAYPSDLRNESVERACAAVLSDYEREKASRFVLERHRHEYIAAHALVRNALSHQHPFPPETWQFRMNTYGKPTPETNRGLQFNLSTCEELVVCLVARGVEVGVDAEPLTRGEEIVSLKDEVFTPAEGRQLDQMDGAARLDRAVSLWVLKEAYTKARGFGLALPLRTISFLFGGLDGIRLEAESKVDADPSSWRFCLIDLAGHRVAAVTYNFSAVGTSDESRAGHSELEVVEVRPPLCEPKKIDVFRSEWFPRVR